MGSIVVSLVGSVTHQAAPLVDVPARGKLRVSLAKDGLAVDSSPSGGRV